jgi:hypothetical protein
MFKMALIFNLIMLKRWSHQTVIHNININDKVKVRCQVVPMLSLTEHHAMKAYWGVEV